MKRIRELGYPIKLDTDGNHPGKLKEVVLEGLVDYVATDAHAAEGRGTCMTEGMKALEQRYGAEAADRIRKNAEALAT